MRKCFSGRVIFLVIFWSMKIMCVYVVKFLVVWFSYINIYIIIGWNRVVSVRFVVRCLGGWVSWSYILKIIMIRSENMNVKYVGECLLDWMNFVNIEWDIMERNFMCVINVGLFFWIRMFWNGI